MSSPIELARAKRAEMTAAGIQPNLSVKLTPEVKAKIAEGMSRTDFTSIREYVIAAALQVAGLDAQKPKRVFSKKTPEQLEEEAAKILARAAALKAQQG